MELFLLIFMFLFFIFLAIGIFGNKIVLRLDEIINLLKDIKIGNYGNSD